MTTRAILLRAAELIEKRGHAHGAFQSRLGALCAAGAINVAAGNRPSMLFTGDTLDALHLLKQAVGYDRTAEWNDKSSHSTVIAGLRKAAEAAG